jgi:hypothetical protein
VIILKGDDDDREDAENDVGMSRKRKSRRKFPTEGNVNRKGLNQDVNVMISCSQAKVVSCLRKVELFSEIVYRHSGE